jgi:hypothetical protein
MTDHTPTKLAQEITFLLCVLEVPNSIFGQQTDHPEVLRGFRHSSFKIPITTYQHPLVLWLVHGGSFISSYLLSGDYLTTEHYISSEEVELF